MFLLSNMFVIVCGLFEWKLIYAGYLSFDYIYIAVGDLVMKKEGLGSH
jgi:hypothetical protein